MKKKCKLILEMIPKGKDNPVTARTLEQVSGLHGKQIRDIISELREDYPICSRTTDGGGYWIATDEADTQRFINQMVSRRKAVNTTIANMIKHLTEAE